jgi:hypothetical protein
MNPQTIPMAKNVIRALSAADTQPFLAKVLKQTTAMQVENLIREAYGDIISKATTPD